MTGHFTDDAAARRFEYVVNGFVAYATYRREGTSLYIDRVEAPMELRGTGAAGRLMEEIVGVAEKGGLTIVPICPYAVSWLAKRNGTPPNMKPGGPTP